MGNYVIQELRNTGTVPVTDTYGYLGPACKFFAI